MTLFRRTGEPIAVPDVHEHERTLTSRKDAAARDAAQLAARVTALTEEHRVCLLESRFDDAALVGMELESVKPEHERAKATAASLRAAAHEVAAERARLDTEQRLAELEATRDAAADRAAQKLAELPVLAVALQDLARGALDDEAVMQSAEFDAHTLRAQIRHWGDPSVPISRPNLPRPVTAEFERHPEYRALANKVWWTGAPNVT